MLKADRSTPQVVVVESESKSKVHLISEQIKDHFDNRYGQFPPLNEAEAMLLAQEIYSSFDRSHLCKGR
jgi:hypothetical protein